MFLLSAIIKIFIRAETVLLIVLLAACALHFFGKVVAARRLIYATTIVLFALAIIPVGQWLLRPLESAYPANASPDRIDGIIVLGGSELELETANWGQPNTNNSGERYINAMILANRYPQARIIFAGGGPIDPISEADVARMIFIGSGIDDRRLVIENRSRNTFENARNARQMVADGKTGIWLLVTSAAHMPRALASFCAAGWQNVLPWPTDYVTGNLQPGFDLIANLSVLNNALREWVGLLAYRLLGRTDQIFADGC